MLRAEPRRIDPIPDATDAHDGAGAPAQHAPDTSNVDIHGAASVRQRAPERALVQVIPAGDPSFAPDELEQHATLAERERELHARAESLRAIRAHRKHADGQDLVDGSARGLDGALRRAHARESSDGM